MPVDALRLSDPRWLAGRVDEGIAFWRCADRRVVTTLWWYAASSAIVFPLVAEGVRGEPVRRRDWNLGRLLPSGDLDSLAGASTKVPVDQLADHTAEVCAPIIGALASLGDVREAPLWALLGDSIAARALDAARGRTPADPYLVNTLDDESRGAMRRASELTDDVARRLRKLGHPLPRPRFVDVSRTEAVAVEPADVISPGAIRAVRRSSCCLVFHATAAADEPGLLCASCPRHAESDRASRMSAALWERGI